MLWKIFSGIAAIFLGVGVYFSLQTKDALKQELELNTRAHENLKSLEEKLKTGADIKGKREKEFQDREAELTGVKAEQTKIDADINTKNQEIEVIKKNLEEVNKQLLALEDQISKAGDIKKLLAKIDELNKQKEAAQALIANHQQQLALKDDQLTKVNAEITRLDEVDKRQRGGVVEPGFTARISHPYTSFGFVILNKGNLGGMFANAILDVKRGSRIVARLKVRDVEQSMSVADLVPGSMPQGETIRTGDLVVAAKLPPPPAPPPTPQETPPAQAPGGAPSPFAPPAPGMAPPTPAPPATPGAGDPFAPAAPAGGMAPAPAPAPGTPPATPPAGADPFAPQPPAGGAPAPGTPPAAPGATTPPAGADPFAPQPGGTPPAKP